MILRISPNDAAREARIDPASASNAHPGISFNRVNEGVYFPVSDQEVRDAEAQGKRLPVGKAYVLMPFTDPKSGAKAPFVVELTAWKPKPKEPGAGPENSEPVTWYGGSAKIFDRDAYVAASRKHGEPRDHLGPDELAAAAVPDDEHFGQPVAGIGPDEDAARTGAGKRARRRQDPAPPVPDDTL